jgi:hypothetical protein
VDQIGSHEDLLSVPASEYPDREDRKNYELVVSSELFGLYEWIYRLVYQVIWLENELLDHW